MSIKKKYVIELTDAEVEVLDIALNEVQDHAGDDESFNEDFHLFSYSQWEGACQAFYLMKELK